MYRDTVTLYHADAAAQTVVRTVLRGVCWQQGRRELPDAGGTRRGTALLVVIPETTARYGADYTLAPGDRLFPGEGPALTWADWPGFVPAAVEGAALVQYVLPMRLRGKPHHVEAGAWWNGSGTGREEPDKVRIFLASPPGEKLPPAGGWMRAGLRGRTMNGRAARSLPSSGAAAPPSVYALKAAFGGCAPTRGLRAQPLGEGFKKGEYDGAEY